MESGGLTLGDRESGLAYCANCNLVVNSWRSCWQPLASSVCIRCGEDSSLRPLASHDPEANSRFGSGAFLCPCCGFDHLTISTLAMIELEHQKPTPGTVIHCRVVTPPENGVCQAALWPSGYLRVQLHGVEPSLLHWWCEAELEDDIGKARFLKPIVDSGVRKLRELEIQSTLRLDMTHLLEAVEQGLPEARPLWTELLQHLPPVISKPSLRIDPIEADWAIPGLATIAVLLYDHPSSLLGLWQVWNARNQEWMATPPASIGLGFSRDEILWLCPPWNRRPYGNEYSDRISNFTNGVKALLIRDESGALVTQLPAPARSEPLDLGTLQERARAGAPQAQYDLGLEYEKGERLTQDRGLALQWFMRAAEQWHGQACWKVGKAYLEGIPEVVLQDRAHAAKWVKRAWDKDVEESFFTMGELFREGVGVEQDLERARDCFSAAGRKEHAQGHLLAGQMYARGEGGRHCYASAHWHLTRAAEKGLAEAELELGLLHHSHDETEKALDWFRRAAEHGLQEAYKYL